MVAPSKPKATLEDVPLVREFLDDHRKMSQLMLHVVVSLEIGNLDEATAAAEKLDQIAGPHIAFEETELYPRISGEKLISDTTRQLCDEHREALMALKALLEDPQPDEEQLAKILGGLKTGVRHAEHCGSMVSLLAALPEPEQSDSLARLLELRREGKPWTDRIR